MRYLWCQPAKVGSAYCTPSCAAIAGHPDKGPAMPKRATSLPPRPAPEVACKGPEPLEHVDLDGTTTVMLVKDNVVARGV